MTTTIDDVTGEVQTSLKYPRRRTSLQVWLRSLIRLDSLAVATGALFFCLSLTPSLMPRGWFIAGLISGINAAIGYGIGAVLSVVAQRLLRSRRDWWLHSKQMRYGYKTVIVVLSIAAGLVMLIPAASWQRDIAAVIGIDGPSTGGYCRTLIVALATGVALLGAVRVIRGAIGLLTRTMIHRWNINDEIAKIMGTAIVVAMLITVLNGVFYRGFISGSRAIFQPHNATTSYGVIPPTRPEKSGSADSFAPWNTLGFQGRNFVATGPSAEELTVVNGKPADEPIRIYAGLKSASTDEDRMAIVLRELERTRAYEREVLVIIPTTGTGWVNPVAARAIEAMYNGNTALVAMQYSYLPSWISFLANQTEARNAGKAMVDAVAQHWAQWPSDNKPKLMLYGESLGALSGQGAFTSITDIVDKGFSSVLWVGPPHASSLWRTLTTHRDSGSPEVQPQYDNGRTVRFTQAASPEDIARVAAPPWPGTRVLFMQHASDPVVWWSPDLFFERPDWLKEPPGLDRAPAMRWYPIITLWQVSADLTANISGAGLIPSWHGHNYGTGQLDGWVAVAAPAGWTAEDTERIRVWLRRSVAAGGPEFG